MLATIIMDKMGNLHIWTGTMIPVKVDRYEDREGNLPDKVIRGDGVREWLGELSFEEKSNLRDGNYILAKLPTAKYFPELFKEVRQ